MSTQQQADLRSKPFKIIAFQDSSINILMICKDENGNEVSIPSFTKVEVLIKTWNSFISQILFTTATLTGNEYIPVNPINPPYALTKQLDLDGSQISLKLTNEAEELISVGTHDCDITFEDETGFRNIQYGQLEITSASYVDSVSVFLQESSIININFANVVMNFVMSRFNQVPTIQ